MLWSNKYVRHIDTVRQSAANIKLSEGLWYSEQIIWAAFMACFFYFKLLPKDMHLETWGFLFFSAWLFLNIIVFPFIFANYYIIRRIHFLAPCVFRSQTYVSVSSPCWYRRAECKHSSRDFSCWAAQSVFPPLPPWSSRSEELYPYEGLIHKCLQLPAGFVSLFSILTTLFWGGGISVSYYISTENFTSQQ